MVDIIVIAFMSLIISVGLTEFIQPNQLELYGMQGYLFSVALYTVITFIVMCFLIYKGSELE